LLSPSNVFITISNTHASNILCVDDVVDDVVNANGGDGGDGGDRGGKEAFSGPSLTVEDVSFSLLRCNVGSNGKCVDCVDCVDCVGDGDDSCGKSGIGVSFLGLLNG
jgi:hypothetical protein